MSIRNTAAVVAQAAAIALVLTTQAHALDPEWEWKVSWQYPPVFQTKAAAVAHMHSLGSVDWRYPLLTIEKKVVAISETTETYRL